MVFSSTVFLFVFLPLVLVAYIGLPQRARNPLLLCASLFFYAWGETWIVLTLVGSILFNHAVGLRLDRTRSRRLLAFGVSANLLLLGVFKYLDFLVENLNAALAPLRGGEPLLPLPGIALPMGISFFTFQVVSYLVDIFRGGVRAQRNVLDFGLYVALFPQLIAGPIVRYAEIAPQLRQRTLSFDACASGVGRFLVGLAKKMVLANLCSDLADQVFAVDPQLLGAPLAWVGVAALTLFIYFDFSGYSDMAIGLGRIFGFTIPENFAYPFVSRSIREIWSRWHLTLTRWFRDYLYIPLGGSRRGPARTYLNLVTVFVLCGLWHGASWNYVVFGLYHGVFLVLERQRVLQVFRRLWRPLQHVYALAVWMLGLAIFQTASLADAWTYLGALVGANGVTSDVALLVRGDHRFALVAGALCSLPWVPALKNWLRTKSGSELGAGWFGVGLHAARVVALLALFVLACLQLAGGTHNPFLYFRF